jgi:hypothetical protein
VSWTRDRLDGAAGYKLIVEAAGTHASMRRHSPRGQTRCG